MANGDQEREGVGWDGWKERQVFYAKFIRAEETRLHAVALVVGNASPLVQASEWQSC